MTDEWAIEKARKIVETHADYEGNYNLFEEVAAALVEARLAGWREAREAATSKSMHAAFVRHIMDAWNTHKPVHSGDGMAQTAANACLASLEALPDPEEKVDG